MRRKPPAGGFAIAADPATDPEVLALLQHHLDEMHANSPACKVHAMPAKRLREADVSFFVARADGALAAVGALKDLGDNTGEIKSMRAARAWRGTGAGEAILLHLIAEARQRGYRWLGLETGCGPVFEPAHGLYRKHGFAPCEAYADYVIDDFSTCMGMDL